MNADYINPFLVATINTFERKFDCRLTRGTPYLKKKQQPEHETGCAVHLSGRAEGLFVLSLSRQVSLKVTEKLSGERLSEINSDVTDAIREMANMIVKESNTRFELIGASLRLPPEILTKYHFIDFPAKVFPICVPFESAWGDVTVEVGIEQIAVSPQNR